MRRHEGDLWIAAREEDLVLITTNRQLDGNGRLVMGAGIARQARDRYSTLPRVLGERVQSYVQQDQDYGFLPCTDLPVGCFQTKRDWRDPADPALIRQAAEELGKWCRDHPRQIVHLPFPGIGRGGLDRETVRPLIKPLPDQVIAWTHGHPDRTDGDPRRGPSPRLSVELVPKSSWEKNVRAAVSQAEWDAIRKAVYDRAGYQCEVCGGTGTDHPIECHEKWVYDDEACVQKLTGMVALCPACHQVKHLGRAYATGQFETAKKHLASVNGWSPKRARTYIERVVHRWNERNEKEWSVDMSLLKSERYRSFLREQGISESQMSG